MTHELIPEFYPGREVILVIPATVKACYGDESIEVQLATHETSLCFSAKRLREMQREVAP